jgi:hypothetical protein
MNGERFIIYTLERILLRRISWMGRVALIGEKRHLCKILARELQGKLLLGRHERCLMDNIKIVLDEIICELQLNDTGYRPLVGFSE